MRRFNLRAVLQHSKQHTSHGRSWNRAWRSIRGARSDRPAGDAAGHFVFEHYGININSINITSATNININTGPRAAPGVTKHRTWPSACKHSQRKTQTLHMGSKNRSTVAENTRKETTERIPAQEVPRSSHRTEEKRTWAASL